MDDTGVVLASVSLPRAGNLRAYVMRVNLLLDEGAILPKKRDRLRPALRASK